MESIPVIDISPWTTDGESYSDETRQAVCQQWDDAFCSVGFAVIVGHGITAEVLEDVTDEARSWFANDIVTKMQYHRGPYGNPDGGYTPSLSESVTYSLGNSTGLVSGESLPDPVESFVMMPHSCCDAFKQTLPLSWSYCSRVQSLLHKLHEISTSTLLLDRNGDNASQDYFRKYYDPDDPNAMGCEPPSYSLRLAYYPCLNEHDSAQGECGSSNAYRYGPHTDYMGYTILRADPSDWVEDNHTGGLEVWIKGRQEWVPVRIPTEFAATALIVNAGDLFQRWTNDAWKSALHRVSNPAPGSSAWRRDRFSLVFFSGPMNDSTISTIPGVGANGQAKYEPVVAGDYLLSKISPTALK